MTEQEIREGLEIWIKERKFSVQSIALMANLTPNQLYAFNKDRKPAEKTLAALEKFLKKGEKAWEILKP